MPKSPTLRFDKHLKLQQQEWKENAAVFIKYSPLNVVQTVAQPADISARDKKILRDAEMALKAGREKMKIEWQKRHPQIITVTSREMIDKQNRAAEVKGMPLFYHTTRVTAWKASRYKGLPKTATTQDDGKTIKGLKYGEFLDKILAIGDHDKAKVSRQKGHGYIGGMPLVATYKNEPLPPPTSKFMALYSDAMPIKKIFKTQPPPSPMKKVRRNVYTSYEKDEEEIEEEKYDEQTADKEEEDFEEQTADKEEEDFEKQTADKEEDFEKQTADKEEEDFEEQTANMKEEDDEKQMEGKDFEEQTAYMEEKDITKQNADKEEEGFDEQKRDTKEDYEQEQSLDNEKDVFTKQNVNKDEEDFNEQNASIHEENFNDQNSFREDTEDDETFAECEQDDLEEENEEQFEEERQPERIQFPERELFPETEESESDEAEQVQVLEEEQVPVLEEEQVQVLEEEKELEQNEEESTQAVKDTKHEQTVEQEERMLVKDEGECEQAVEQEEHSQIEREKEPEQVATEEKCEQKKEREAEEETVEQKAEEETVERKVEEETVEQEVEEEMVERRVEDKMVEREINEEMVEREVKDDTLEREQVKELVYNKQENKEARKVEEERRHQEKEKDAETWSDTRGYMSDDKARLVSTLCSLCIDEDGKKGVTARTPTYSNILKASRKPGVWHPSRATASQTDPKEFSQEATSDNSSISGCSMRTVDIEVDTWQDQWRIGWKISESSRLKQDLGENDYVHEMKDESPRFPTAPQKSNSQEIEIEEEEEEDHGLKGKYSVSSNTLLAWRDELENLTLGKSGETERPKQIVFGENNYVDEMTDKSLRIPVLPQKSTSHEMEYGEEEDHGLRGKYSVSSYTLLAWRDELENLTLDKFGETGPDERYDFTRERLDKKAITFSDSHIKMVKDDIYVEDYALETERDKLARGAKGLAGSTKVVTDETPETKAAAVNLAKSPLAIQLQRSSIDGESIIAVEGTLQEEDLVTPIPEIEISKCKSFNQSDFEVVESQLTLTVGDDIVVEYEDEERRVLYMGMAPEIEVCKCKTFTKDEFETVETTLVVSANDVSLDYIPTQEYTGETQADSVPTRSVEADSVQPECFETDVLASEPLQKTQRTSEVNEPEKPDVITADIFSTVSMKYEAISSLVDDDFKRESPTTSFRAFANVSTPPSTPFDIEVEQPRADNSAFFINVINSTNGSIESVAQDSLFLTEERYRILSSSTEAPEEKSIPTEPEPIRTVDSMPSITRETWCLANADDNAEMEGVAYERLQNIIPAEDILGKDQKEPSLGYPSESMSSTTLEMWCLSMADECAEMEGVCIHSKRKRLSKQDEEKRKEEESTISETSSGFEYDEFLAGINEKMKTAQNYLSTSIQEYELKSRSIVDEKMAAARKELIKSIREFKWTCIDDLDEKLINAREELMQSITKYKRKASHDLDEHLGNARMELIMSIKEQATGAEMLESFEQQVEAELDEKLKVVRTELIQDISEHYAEAEKNLHDKIQEAKLELISTGGYAMESKRDLDELMDTSRIELLHSIKDLDEKLKSPRDELMKSVLEHTQTVGCDIERKLKTAQEEMIKSLMEYKLEMYDKQRHSLEPFGMPCDSVDELEAYTDLLSDSVSDDKIISARYNLMQAIKERGHMAGKDKDEKIQAARYELMQAIRERGQIRGKNLDEDTKKARKELMISIRERKKQAEKELDEKIIKVQKEIALSFSDHVKLSVKGLDERINTAKGEVMQSIADSYVRAESDLDVRIGKVHEELLKSVSDHKQKVEKDLDEKLAAASKELVSSMREQCLQSAGKQTKEETINEPPLMFSKVPLNANVKAELTEIRSDKFAFPTHDNTKIIRSEGEVSAMVDGLLRKVSDEMHAERHRDANGPAPKHQELFTTIDRKETVQKTSIKDTTKKPSSQPLETIVPSDATIHSNACSLLQNSDANIDVGVGILLKIVSADLHAESQVDTEGSDVNIASEVFSTEDIATAFIETVLKEEMKTKQHIISKPLSETKRMVELANVQTREAALQKPEISRGTSSEDNVSGAVAGLLKKVSDEMHAESRRDKEGSEETVPKVIFSTENIANDFIENVLMNEIKEKNQNITKAIPESITRVELATVQPGIPILQKPKIPQRTLSNGNVSATVAGLLKKVSDEMHAESRRDNGDTEEILIKEIFSTENIANCFIENVLKNENTDKTQMISKSLSETKTMDEITNIQPVKSALQKPKITKGTLSEGSVSATVAGLLKKVSDEMHAESRRDEEGKAEIILKEIFSNEIIENEFTENTLKTEIKQKPHIISKPLPETVTNVELAEILSDKSILQQSKIDTRTGSEGNVSCAVAELLKKTSDEMLAESQRNKGESEDIVPKEIFSTENLANDFIENMLKFEIKEKPQTINKVHPELISVVELPTIQHDESALQKPEIIKGTLSEGHVSATVAGLLKKVSDEMHAESRKDKEGSEEIVPKEIFSNEIIANDITENVLRNEIKRKPHIISNPLPERIANVELAEIQSDKSISQKYEIAKRTCSESNVCATVAGLLKKVSDEMHAESQRDKGGSEEMLPNEFFSNEMIASDFIQSVLKDDIKQKPQMIAKGIPDVITTVKLENIQPDESALHNHKIAKGTLSEGNVSATVAGLLKKVCDEMHAESRRDNEGSEDFIPKEIFSNEIIANDITENVLKNENKQKPHIISQPLPEPFSNVELADIQSDTSTVRKYKIATKSLTDGNVSATVAGLLKKVSDEMHAESRRDKQGIEEIVPKKIFSNEIIANDFIDNVLKVEIQEKPQTVAKPPPEDITKVKLPTIQPDESALQQPKIAKGMLSEGNVSATVVGLLKKVSEEMNAESRRDKQGIEEIVPKEIFSNEIIANDFIDNVLKVEIKEKPQTIAKPLPEDITKVKLPTIQPDESALQQPKIAKGMLSEGNVSATVVGLLKKVSEEMNAESRRDKVGLEEIVPKEIFSNEIIANDFIDNVLKVEIKEKPQMIPNTIPDDIKTVRRAKDQFKEFPLQKPEVTKGTCSESNASATVAGLLKKVSEEMHAESRRDKVGLEEIVPKEIFSNEIIANDLIENVLNVDIKEKPKPIAKTLSDANKTVELPTIQMNESVLQKLKITKGVCSEGNVSATVAGLLKRVSDEMHAENRRDNEESELIVPKEIFSNEIIANDFVQSVLNVNIKEKPKEIAKTLPVANTTFELPTIQMNDSVLQKPKITKGTLSESNVSATVAGLLKKVSEEMHAESRRDNEESEEIVPKEIFSNEIIANEFIQSVLKFDSKEKPEMIAETLPEATKIVELPTIQMDESVLQKPKITKGTCSEGNVSATVAGLLKKVSDEMHAESRRDKEGTEEILPKEIFSNEIIANEFTENVLKNEIKTKPHIISNSLPETIANVELADILSDKSTLQKSKIDIRTCSEGNMSATVAGLLKKVSDEMHVESRKDKEILPNEIFSSENIANDFIQSVLEDEIKQNPQMISTSIPKVVTTVQLAEIQQQASAFQEPFVTKGACSDVNASDAVARLLKKASDEMHAESRRDNEGSEEIVPKEIFSNEIIANDFIENVLKVETQEKPQTVTKTLPEAITVVEIPTIEPDESVLQKPKIAKGTLSEGNVSAKVAGLLKKASEEMHAECRRDKEGSEEIVPKEIFSNETIANDFIENVLKVEIQEKPQTVTKTLPEAITAVELPTIEPDESVLQKPKIPKGTLSEGNVSAKVAGLLKKTSEEMHAECRRDKEGSEEIVPKEIFSNETIANDFIENVLKVEIQEKPQTVAKTLPEAITAVELPTIEPDESVLQKPKITKGTCSEGNVSATVAGLLKKVSDEMHAESRRDKEGTEEILPKEIFSNETIANDFTESLLKNEIKNRPHIISKPLPENIANVELAEVPSDKSISQKSKTAVRTRSGGNVDAAVGRLLKEVSDEMHVENQRDKCLYDENVPNKALPYDTRTASQTRAEIKSLPVKTSASDATYDKPETSNSSHLKLLHAEESVLEADELSEYVVFVKPEDANASVEKSLLRKDIEISEANVLQTEDNVETEVDSQNVQNGALHDVTSDDLPSGTSVVSDNAPDDVNYADDEETEVDDPFLNKHKVLLPAAVRQRANGESELFDSVSSSEVNIEQPQKDRTSLSFMPVNDNLQTSETNTQDERALPEKVETSSNRSLLDDLAAHCSKQQAYQMKEVFSEDFNSDPGDGNVHIDENLTEIEYMSDASSDNLSLEFDENRSASSCKQLDNETQSTIPYQTTVSGEQEECKQLDNETQNTIPYQTTVSGEQEECKQLDNETQSTIPYQTTVSGEQEECSLDPETSSSTNRHHQLTDAEEVKVLEAAVSRKGAHAFSRVHIANVSGTDDHSAVMFYMYDI